VKLVMTLLVRNEADVIDEHLSFHLNAGVDFVIAMDNGSDDGTVDILERYAKDGSLLLLHEPSSKMGAHQAEWMTRMARLAATELDADWVINSDADEFWCSRRGSLKSLLAQIPVRYSSVRALLRNFAPRRTERDRVTQRMTLRIVPGKLPRESPFHAHPFHPQDKVIHRAHPDVTLSAGNHDAWWAGSMDLRGWWPFETLHFPLRSIAQCRRKWENWERYDYPGYVALNEGGPEEYYLARCLDDPAASAGLDGGWLVDDLRLHDGTTEEPEANWGDDARFAADVSSGGERDSVRRLGVRVEALEGRVAALERHRMPSLRRMAR
jgi:Glycosyl transferase family 2